jgi:CRISPR-associated protein Cas2
MEPEKLKMGWLLVAFDLPVLTKEQRKAATDFRKFLIDDGYLMIQLSVYARPCISFARQQTHLERLKKHIPPEGAVRAIFITKAQWERSFVIYGKPVQEVAPEKIPEQLQFW